MRLTLMSTLGLIIILIISFSVHSKEIVFNMSQEGFAPFMIVDQGKQSGIMKDVLTEIAAKTGHTIKIVRYPRKRFEKATYQKSIDCSGSALEWVSHPQKFSKTEPIASLRDIIYSLKSKKLTFNKPSDFKGRSVGGVLGYHYPNLQKIYKKYLFDKQDSATEGHLLKKLYAGRINGIVCNEFVCDHLIKKYSLDKTLLTKSKLSLGSAEYRFLFGTQWERHIPSFNKVIGELKSSGKMEKIFEKYR
jgi:polar amino acid transport system substrate-binding protein